MGWFSSSDDSSDDVPRIDEMTLNDLVKEGPEGIGEAVSSSWNS